MRLLVRASTIRAPTLNPPRPRIFGIGLDRDTARATAAAVTGNEARGQDADTASAQPLLARVAYDADRARAIPLIRGIGRDSDRATATPGVAVNYVYNQTFILERHEDLAAATFTDYPARIRLSGAWLKQSNLTGGRIRSASAYDVIFDLPDGTRLDHEIESYDGTAGEMWVAIREPSWAAASAQFIFRVRYGASL